MRYFCSSARVGGGFWLSLCAHIWGHPLCTQPCFKPGFHDLAPSLRPFDWSAWRTYLIFFTCPYTFHSSSPMDRRSCTVVLFDSNGEVVFHLITNYWRNCITQLLNSTASYYGERDRGGRRGEVVTGPGYLWKTLCTLTTQISLLKAVRISAIKKPIELHLPTSLQMYLIKELFFWQTHPPLPGHERSIKHS